MTDPIADMIIRIKNAVMVHHPKVTVPHSNVRAAIAQILKDRGYIVDFEVVEKKPQSEIVLTLKYLGRLSSISGVKRISKPGRRLYTTATTIPKTLGGYGITIVSTSKGILTGDEARKQNVGGELLCQIW